MGVFFKVAQEVDFLKGGAETARSVFHHGALMRAGVLFHEEGVQAHKAYDLGGTVDVFVKFGGLVVMFVQVVAHGGEKCLHVFSFKFAAPSA